jgi:hypothetical protein
MDSVAPKLCVTQHFYGGTKLLVSCGTNSTKARIQNACCFNIAVGDHHAGGCCKESLDCKFDHSASCHEVLLLLVELL